MEDIAAQSPADLTREFIYSIDVPEADESDMQRQLQEAFPELTWRDGESNFGKIFLAGESPDAPPRTRIFLLRRESPGPFKLMVRILNAGLIRAVELKDRLMQALPGSAMSQDRVPFLNEEDSIPWVNAPEREGRAVPDLPPVKSSGRHGVLELKIPVERPCVAIFSPGLEILISRALLEAMEAYLDQSETPQLKAGEDERLEILRAARARDILRAAVPAGTDGNYQVARSALPTDTLFLLGQLLENGLAEVVHFNNYGQALSAKRINMTPFGVRAGPTAGFGGVFFNIGLFGPEILGLNAWVS